MKAWKKLYSKREAAPHLLTPLAGASSPLDEDPHEEVDLIALQSTPEEFIRKDCDVLAFELNNLSAQYTTEEIAEVKELRERQLDVRSLHYSRQLPVGRSVSCEVWFVWLRLQKGTRSGAGPLVSIRRSTLA